MRKHDTKEPSKLKFNESDGVPVDGVLTIKNLNDGSEKVLKVENGRVIDAALLRVGKL